ncbi:transglutaminaseTgpA domain-containing protein [Pseudoalteromonas sp. SSM20]|uniref:transglutaminase family protein n=1 Tax=Pseudoalteromonas sp. SSM20 TaxID=3139394 RepID=UPI003BA95F75
MFNHDKVKSLSALIIAIVSALLFDDLALFFVATVALLIVWVFAVCYTKASAPTMVVANILAIACTLTLFLTIGISELVNLFVAMLLQANCLKLLIATKPKQIKSIVLVNFFIACCVFLFYQSLPVTFLVLSLFLINITALYLLTNRKLVRQSSVRAFKLLALSLPITCVLFLFLPKLPAFWRMPSLSSAQVGLSESVNPFNISNLTKSDKLAFRALLPSNYQAPYYWRAMVHEEFDGKSWNIAKSADNILPFTQIKEYGNTIKIYHEQSSLKWLPSLFYSKANAANIVTTENGNLYRVNPNNQKFSYEFTEIELSQQLTNNQRVRNTRLPAEINMASISLANQLKAQANSTEMFINLLARYYSDNGFIYTLKPPIYDDKNAIDQFISGKEGFCGHYASTSAFIFRAAGIPARVVSGYLGGEFSENNEYLSVYQYDAHAWTEVWVENKGWVKFDATAYVEPDRLFGSLSQLDSIRNEFEDNIGLGLISLSEIAIFNELRLYLEQLDYQWTAWVLGFDNTAQEKLLKELMEDVSALKIAIIIMSLIGLFLLTFLALKLWQRRIRYDDPIVYYLFALENYAKGKGLIRKDGETVDAFITRLSQLIPHHKKDLMSFLMLYSRHRYGGKTLSKAQVKVLKRNVNNIKYKRQL